MLAHKYYVDEIYDATIVTPARVDVARAALARHRPGMIDGLGVNGTRVSRRALGWLGSQLQSGQLGTYAWVFDARRPRRARRVQHQIIPISEFMNSLLTSIGYYHWMLSALLLIPLLGAAVIWIHGATATVAPGDEVGSGAASAPRMLALITFAVEFVVSLGLWWSFDPANVDWQSVVDSRGFRRGACGSRSASTASR